MKYFVATCVCACACSNATSLDVTGNPVTCSMLGGLVEGTVIDPAGASETFKTVQAALFAPDQIVLDDGMLQLTLGIGGPPREFSLSFPDRTVFATTGKVVIDEDVACHAGRFNTVFLYHGQVTGWFAVP